MSVSMYQSSIPVFVRFLNNLSEILSQAEKFAESKKIDESVLVNARLAPDMYPLSRQIQIASDAVKGCTARLAGLELPSFPDTETTFAELQARIQKTKDFVQSVTPEQIDGSEIRPITLKVGGHELSFEGRSYLSNFVLPNFFFHISMTYAILRHNGVDLGKKTYLGDPIAA